MGIKISLNEFEEVSGYNITQIKDWFPKGKFDKRFPQDFITKWLRANSTYLKFLGISHKWDESNKKLILIPGNKVGLAPLKNPYGGKVYGSIVIKPRLGWFKIYEILDHIEWTYQPTFLKDEEPIISDGALPKWFKAIETLEAISNALNVLMRRMHGKRIISNVPIGSIHWNEYASNSLPYAKFNHFPTTVMDFSADLDIHRQFKGVVKMITHDIATPEVPIKIKAKARILINKINNILNPLTDEEPDIEKLRKIRLPGFFRSSYDKAIQTCIKYINESKFSMTTGNFSGLPWVIEMDRLFEYWVEYWAAKFAKRIGARFFSDIQKNTRIKFYNLANWKSLKILKPDIIIEKADKTLIIDAKYKKHLMYFHYDNITQEIIEEHRNDIHQILSYMSSSNNKIRIGCLIYPKVNDAISNQFSTLINYTNTSAYVDVALCNVNFEPNSILGLLENLWTEKYKDSK